MKLQQNSTFSSLLTRCRLSCTCHAQRHLNAQQWSEHVVFFDILTWKCASRQNGVHLFDISASKSGRNMWYFVHLDLDMFFAPQRPAFFHLSCGQMAPAALANLLLESFGPSGATNHWKSTMNCDFPTFSCTCIFFLLALSLLHRLTSFIPSLPAFPSRHIVGSLTSKLPWANMLCIHTINICICLYAFEQLYLFKRQ